MEYHQLRLGREARQVAEPGAMLTLLDMAGVLIDAGYSGQQIADALPWPQQGNVSKWDRFQEAISVVSELPEPLLDLARRYPPDWHALREPARWVASGDVNGTQLYDFVREFTERKGRWPRTDELRVSFGKASGHKGPGDVPGQEVLL